MIRPIALISSSHHSKCSYFVRASIDPFSHCYNIAIISVFAKLLKNYFKALYCRDKRSITKTDLMTKLFEVIYLNGIRHRSSKRDFDNIQITAPCGTNLILYFWHHDHVEISKKYMIILRKEYASEAGVSGMKKVKNPLNFS